MTDHAVRVKAPTGWVDLAYIATGPQGPAGPKGDTGATGGNATVAIDPWHLIGAGGEPAFQNTWRNYGGGEMPAGFRKDPLGHVSVKGLVTAGTQGVPIFTLPTGYRPITSMRFICPAYLSGFGSAVVYVDASGAVFAHTYISPGGNNFVDLSVIEFDIESVTQMPTGPTGPQGPAGPGVRGLVGALPSNPQDGDECYYQNATMASLGVLWHLRYRAAASGPYKWEFMGGGAWFKSGTGGAGIAISGYVNTDYAGRPEITAPLSGDYEIFGKLNGYLPAGNTWELQLIAGNFTQWVGIMPGTTSATAYQRLPLAGVAVVPGIPAAGSIRLFVKGNGGSWTIDSDAMSVRPVRVG